MLKRQEGFSLILVLISLVLVSVILVALFSFLGTNVKAMASRMTRQDLIYAADSGVQYAIRDILSGNATIPDPFIVNDSVVTSDYLPVSEGDRQFIASIAGITSPGQIYNAKHPNAVEGYNLDISTDHYIANGAGVFRITIVNVGIKQCQNIKSIGVWRSENWEYLNNKLNLESLPNIINTLSGQSLIWEAENNKEIGKIDPGETKIYEFTYNNDNDFLAVAFVSLPNDIWTIYDPPINGVYKIISVATRNNVSKQITSYVLQVGDKYQILTYEIQ